MKDWSGLICFAVGMAVAWVAIPLIQRSRRFSNSGGVAQFHHNPANPVSRFGGLALALAFTVISLVIFVFYSFSSLEPRMRYVIVLGPLAMFLLGFCDDLKPLGARKKLFGQIIIALFIAYGGVQIQNFRNPLNNVIYQLGIFGPLLTVFWVVALTNLINLIDGIDGLAGGIVLMLMGLLYYSGLGFEMSVVMLYAAGMAGALLAFLKFNFPPAKIYMGDGGAYFLGCLVAVLSATNYHKSTVMTALIAPLFVLALPIIDVMLALLRRGLKGLPLFRADRKHIHHRLVELGFSRTRAVLSLYFLCLVFLLLALFVNSLGGKAVPALFGVACLVLVVTAGSFSFSREWFAVGRVLENSLEIRKTTEYALTLSRWLELEAERCGSVEALWGEFEFVVKKFGFAEVSLILEDGYKRRWESDKAQSPQTEWRRERQELVLDRPMVLEFAVSPQAMNARVFVHLCDLASEAWHKAAMRWHRVNRQPISFSPAPVAETKVELMKAPATARV